MTGTDSTGGTDRATAAAAATAGGAPGRAPTLGDLARSDGVRFLLATFTTLTGKPCSKLVPVSAADRMQDAGVGFAGYAAGAIGQQPRDPDLVAIPDVSTYTPLTFLRPGLGMVHCDPHVGGLPHPFAPRVVLRRALESAAAEGVTLKVGTEVEYFLLTRDADGALHTADAFDAADQPCYDSRAVTRMYDHLTAVSDAMDELGWGPYASDHEDGNGQFEQNFAYADAMVTADRVVTLRYLLQVLAEQRGMTATFMPKPFTDRTGNGMHMHLSLWDGDRPLFPAGDSPDPYGLGLGATGYGFVAGLLEHAPALHAVLAPTVNSYKRTGATTTTSGATWAPRFASYGGDDRTHMLRVPDGDRVELRAADGAASSHLATAVALGAGMDGVRRRLDPGAPGAARDSTEVPRTLLEAVQAFESDTVVRGVLDRGGPSAEPSAARSGEPSAAVSAAYAALKRDEFYAYHAVVTPWEVDRYLTGT